VDTRQAAARPRNRLTRREARARLVAGALGAGATAALAACGAPGAGQPAAPTSREPLTLVVGEAGLWATPATQPQWDEIARRWREQFPWITLQSDVTRGTANYLTKLITIEASGSEGPDATQVYSLSASALASKRMISDLMPYLKKDNKAQLLDDLYPQYRDYYNFKGAQVGLTMIGSPHNMYYNRNHIAEAGLKDPWEQFKNKHWTWDTYLEYAQKLTRQRGGQQCWGVMPTDRNTYRMALVVWGNGGDVWNKDVTETRLHEDAATEPMQLQMDLTGRYHVTPSDDEYGKQMEGDELVGWYAGRLSITNGQRLYVPDMEKSASFDKGHVPWPAGKKGRFNSDGFNAFGIYARTKHPDASWQFVRFLSTTGHEVILLAGASLPIRAAMRSDPRYVKSLRPWESADVYDQAAQSSKLVFVPPRFNDIDKALMVGWNNAANGQATVKTEMARLKPSVDALLRAEQYNNLA
jgi:multiple sugar transport system substrate-binding protein